MEEKTNEFKRQSKNRRSHIRSRGNTVAAIYKSLENCFKAHHKKMERKKQK